MNYIDLHVHSSKSDGTLTPAEVAKRAAERGLTAIALPDPDCVSGIAEAEHAAAELRAAGHALRIIPGVEISADYKNGDIHILGLFIEPSEPALTAALSEAIRCRDVRNEKMVQRLRDAGIEITLEALRSEAEDTVITRAHFARFLKMHGYVKNNSEAFRRYLDRDTPFYVPREYLQPERAIELIRGAGGVPVLAHPLLYHLTPDGVKELVARLKAAGLGGIEAIYSANTGSDEGFVRQLAAQYGLAVSGGSDFHGAAKPGIEIGIGRGGLRIPETLLEDLRRA